MKNDKIQKKKEIAMRYKFILQLFSIFTLRLEFYYLERLLIILKISKKKNMFLVWANVNQDSLFIFYTEFELN